MDKYDLGIIKSDLDAAFQELKRLELNLANITEFLVRGAYATATVPLPTKSVDEAASCISGARSSVAHAGVRADNLRRSLTYIHDRLNSTRNAEDAA